MLMMSVGAISYIVFGGDLSLFHHCCTGAVKKDHKEFGRCFRKHAKININGENPRLKTASKRNEHLNPQSDYFSGNTISNRSVAVDTTRIS